MSFLKKSFYKTKQHHKNFLLIVLGAFLTPIFIFGIYSLFPPRVLANTLATTQTLDSPFSAVVWGSLKKDSIKVASEPEAKFTIITTKTSFPLKSYVEFVPQEFLSPNTTYTLKFTLKNWYGVESTKTVTRTIDSEPKVVKVTPNPESKEVNSKTFIKIELNQQISKSGIKFGIEPETPFDLVSENKFLIIKPKKELEQGKQYSYSLNLKSSQFGKLSLYNGGFTTISPLKLASSLPLDQAENILKQQALKLTFNKPLNKDSFEKGFSLTPKTSGSFDWSGDSTVTFQPTSQLLTATKYSLNLRSQIEALDKSHLENSQAITFTTAGLVKVVSFSPSGFYPYLNTPINVTFNQPVDELSAKSHFSIQPEISGDFSFSGNQMIFQPKSLTSLTEYKITVSPGIISLGGLDSGETFTNTFTTTSEQTKTIGYSVQGRPITATYFGIGPKKIILVGSLHGTESNTGKMLNSWISYLRSNQSKIAKDRTFIIIPFANPDGVSKGQRFNSNGVDLNRNWDTPEWQSLTYLQNTSYPKGGGSAPFSEPETKALRNLILSENPTRMITYHSAANMVLGDGISESFGNWYSKLTGYVRIKGSAQEGSNMSALGYIITGTMEDWATARNLVTLVVEFISQSQNEYNRNLPALRGLLNYSL